MLICDIQRKTLGTNDVLHNDNQHSCIHCRYDECQYFLNVMLTALIKLNVVKLLVIKMNEIMLSITTVVLLC